MMALQGVFVVVAALMVPVLATTSSGTLGTPFNFGDGDTKSTTTPSSFTATNTPFNFGPTLTDVSTPYPSTTVNSVITPKAPVITITVPGGYDDQILVGSLIGTASSMYTVAVTCAEGTDPDDCGFIEPVTVTAGPSSYHLRVVFDSPYTFEAACSFSSAGGSCINTDFGTYSGSTRPESSIEVATSSFDGDYLTKVQIYVTAGLTSGAAVSTSPSPTATPVSVLASHNGIPTLAPNAAAAGLVGLAALLF